MRKLGISFVLGLVAVISAAQTPAQSAVPATLTKAGRLLDPRTGNMLLPEPVLIGEGKIKGVGAPAQVQGHVPAGAKTTVSGRQAAGSGSPAADAVYAQPGQLVDAGGFRLNLYCTGSGSPAVVFDSGWGDWAPA